MTIAEKLVKIAETQPKVYDSGVQAGCQKALQELDPTLDTILATQESIIKDGISFTTIYGKYRFNSKAQAEVGIYATKTLEKTNVKFTSNNGEQFTAISCAEEYCNYYGADGLGYPVHESGMFNCISWEDVDLDFGFERQIVTEVFLEWVEYYMERA